MSPAPSLDGRHPMLPISVVVVTYRRDAALAQTMSDLYPHIAAYGGSVEVVLVDNNADGIDRTRFLAGFEVSRLLPQATNTGVAEGRNAGIRSARGSILVFLDDDATLEGTDPLGSILNAFGEDAAIGAVAFRSHDPSTGEADPCEFPHTDKTLPKDRPFDTFRFIGVGHALRREALGQTGGYLPEFHYSMEEFDLSFRLLGRGWRIVYRPSIMVAHRRDPAGRVPNARKVEISVLNKLRIAFMHLPRHLALLSAAAWVGHGFRMRKGPYRLDKVLAEFAVWALRNKRLRRPLPDPVLRQIREMGGVAWR